MVTDLIGLFNFEWHGQNEVGNIDIPVFWRDREKLNRASEILEIGDLLTCCHGFQTGSCL